MWLRVRQIALVANKLAPIVDDMKNVLGLEVCYRDPGVKVFGLENALFPAISSSKWSRQSRKTPRVDATSSAARATAGICAFCRPRNMRR